MRKPKGDTTAKPDGVEDGFDRRSILLGGASAMALSMLAGPSAKAETAAGAQPAPTPASGSKPNILVMEVSAEASGRHRLSAKIVRGDKGAIVVQPTAACAA
jgi:hypothetical protein